MCKKCQLHLYIYCIRKRKGYSFYTGRNEGCILTINVIVRVKGDDNDDDGSGDSNSVDDIVTYESKSGSVHTNE